MAISFRRYTPFSDRPIGESAKSAKAFQSIPSTHSYHSFCGSIGSWPPDLVAAKLLQYLWANHSVGNETNEIEWALKNPIENTQNSDWLMMVNGCLWGLPVHELYNDYMQSPSIQREARAFQSFKEKRQLNHYLSHHFSRTSKIYILLIRKSRILSTTVLSPFTIL